MINELKVRHGYRKGGGGNKKGGVKIGSVLLMNFNSRSQNFL